MTSNISRARFSRLPPYFLVALVGAITQELVQQVAIGTMDHGPIEPCRLGVFRRLVEA
jgi:hypothetical protein